MVWDQGQLPSTKDSILESLHDFLNQFLSGGYNGIYFVLEIGSFFIYLCFHLIAGACFHTELDFDQF